MRTSTFFVFADLLLISTTQLPGVFGGCNVRLVQSATADAQTQAVNAITSAFAACTKCPCNVRVTSEAKVVAEVIKNKSCQNAAALASFIFLIPSESALLYRHLLARS